MRAALLTVLLLLICHFPSHAERRALLIGIGDYPTGITGWQQIHGNADIGLLKPMLAMRGYGDIVTLTDREATKKAIVRAIKELTARSKTGDTIYLHLSGHGQRVKDENGDEPTGLDGSFIPYDAYKTPYLSKREYSGQNHLIDDEIAFLLNDMMTAIGPSGEIFLAVDACYSRGIERGEDEEIEDLEITQYMRGTSDIVFQPKNPSRLKRLPVPPPFTDGARLTVVTACLDTERNFEYKSPDGRMYGSLSYCIYTLLKTDADFSSWRQCFESEDFRQFRIFQPFQHPTITVYN